MQVATNDFEQLLREHRVLMRDYGRAQSRCSEQLRAQAREIERLNAQAMQLRARAIMSETARAWACEDRTALEQTIPGLAKRVTLARRVEVLLARIQDLMRERLHWESSDRRTRRSPGPMVLQPSLPAPSRDEHTENLEASLGAADLVICQTGCLSHGDYWRVQDHCKRTGKTCVLVEQPESVRIVRIHKAGEGNGRARIAPMEQEANS